MSPFQEFIVNPDPTEWWSAHRGASPIVGTAIHNGHHIRSDLTGFLGLNAGERLREEDPQVVVCRQRAEPDQVWPFEHDPAVRRSDLVDAVHLHSAQAEFQRLAGECERGGARGG